jgi:hypothetical protein
MPGGKMEFSEIGRNFKQYGLSRTLGDIALRASNQIIYFRILKCVRIDAVNPEFLKCDDNYCGQFLNAAMLEKFAKSPEYEISEQFLETAMAKGDQCYGFVDGDMLASYGWYSKKPTEIDRPGLAMHFKDGYVYMYKGFTHVNHRGKRLHAVGMTRALEAYLAMGWKGIVSYVEWNNFASLKSCYRMGYRDIGNIYAAEAFHHYFLRSDAACKPYGLRLEQARPQSRAEKPLTALPEERSTEG